jgi:hypothetical protein
MVQMRTMKRNLATFPSSPEDLKDRVEAHIRENRGFVIDGLREDFPYVSWSVI